MSCDYHQQYKYNRCNAYALNNTKFPCIRPREHKGSHEDENGDQWGKGAR